MKTIRNFALFATALLVCVTWAGSARAGVANGWTGGRVDTRHLMGGAVNASKLSDGLLYGTYRYCKMQSQPSLSALNGYGDPTGTTGDTNRAAFVNCNLTAQYHVKGTQTLLGPLLDTTGKGLDISQDQTDNDGVEYVFGANNSYGAFAHTVATSTAACFRVKAEIADVSGTDDFDIGWRKVEAFQANVDDYDEAAWVNVNAGQLYTETILNNAATTTTTVTGSTWVDGATHTIEVCIIGRSPRYYYDGIRVQTSVAHSFDVGEVIEPFLFFLQATTSPGKIYLKEVEIGDKTDISNTGAYPE